VQILDALPLYLNNQLLRALQDQLPANSLPDDGNE